MHADKGFMIGIVKSLDDPENLGRIKVTLPNLGDQYSDWARLVTPMAGKSRGMFFRPEVDDEVVVGFEMGDRRFPYILGSVWSQPDPPPADDGDKKKNNWRFIQSRCGHMLKLDDTASGEKIEIIDKDHKRKIIIDSSGDKIQVICDRGSIEINGSSGDVKVKGTNISITADGTLDLKSNGTLTIKGSTVNIN